MSEAATRLDAALEGRYTIERELGEGGMATVYLADDIKHERKVALKVLKPELAAAVGSQRFLAEIKTTASLRHPHILPLFDSGEADSFLFYVMPYVEGESLRQRLDREEQLPVDEAVRITSEVADALAYAHEAGIIHRDIKPENILFDSGHAVVCDFGIAKAFSDAGGDRLTRTGLSVGTPEYASPEQAAGTDRLDARTDIYSLGCVLYEMLAGGPPYSGRTPQAILARKVMESVPGLRVVRDTVPPALEATVIRALAKVPADRFATAREFAEALSGERRPAPAAVSPWPRLVVRPWLAAGGVVGVLIVAAVLLDRSVIDGPGSSAPLSATFRQLTVQPGVEDSPSISPNGEWLAYAGEGPENRDVFLQSVGGRLPINLTEDSPADDFQPAFSPDGDRIAFRSSREGGGLFVMGRTGEAVRRVSRAGFNPAWSPDGTRLAYATEGVELLPLNWLSVSELWITGVDGGDEVRIYEGDAVQPSWSPSGRRIAFTARMAETAQMDIWTMLAEGGEAVPVTSDAPADWGPTWSADGRYIYFGSDRGGSMSLWRVRVDEASGRALAEPEPLTTPASFVAHPSMSSDGQLVAYSAVLHVQNIETATLDWTAAVLEDRFWLTTGSRQWSSPDPSADGEWVVFYSRDLPEGDLYVTRADGSGQPRQVTADEALDRMPRWSPDRAWISYFSTRSGPLQMRMIRPDGSDDRQLTGGEMASFGSWAPDGSRIAVNGLPDLETGRVHVFDPNRPWGEQAVDTLPLPDSSLGAFQVNDWSPDGKRLAGHIAPLSDAGVVIYFLETRTYDRLTDFGQWPVWLPDSRNLLFVTGGDEFWIVDSETRTLRKIYTSRTDVLGPPRVTGDGRRIVYTRRVTEADVWLMTLR